MLFILLSTIFICIPLVYANYNNISTVNILSWWGYLDDAWVQNSISKKCHINISTDEFYSNDEFLRRLHENKDRYDIIIFPSGDYSVIKNDISLDDSNLYKKSINYENTIKQRYKFEKYAHNITYFQLNFNGFLWNPKLINLSNSDSIQSIFNKSKGKVVIFSDDPIFIYTLFDKDPSNTNTQEVFGRFNSMIRNTQFIITNEGTKLYSDPNFAFSYGFSGILIYMNEMEHLRYKLLMHPQYSVVSADLLAVLNNKSTTTCVANVMSSEEFLSDMQNDSLYFSPYADSKNITDPYFKSIHSQFF